MEATPLAVLATLHQYHDEVPAYGFDTLREIIGRLRPDVLALELTAADLRDRTDQTVKQEYQRAVFPFLRDHPVEVVPLEPDEPAYSALARLSRDSEHALEQSQPERAAAFSVYAEQLLAYFLANWRSPCAVNSSETDAIFAVKYRYQNALFGPGQEAAWEGWNQHFLDATLRAVHSNPGKRVVVLVGVEHAYWLRGRLRGRSEIRLLPNCGFEQPAAVGG